MIDAFKQLEQNEKLPNLIEGTFNREFLHIKNELDTELERLRDLRTERKEINIVSDNEKVFDSVGW